ncbi:MAG: hypothetical protein AAF902_25820, partial [Chloroflexota bacterium]
ESVQIYTERKDWLNLAKSKDLLGYIYYDWDSSTLRAQQSASLALEIFDQLEEVPDKISPLRLQSIIAYKNNDLRKAQKYATFALELSRKLQTSAEEMASLYALVAISRALTLYEEGIAYAPEAIRLAQSTGNKRYEGMVLQELSAIYIQTGKLELAKKYTEQILEIFKTIRDRANFAYAMIQMGDIHKQLNQISQSKSFWNEAKKIATHLQQDRLLTEIGKRMSEL